MTSSSASATAMARALMDDTDGEKDLMRHTTRTIAALAAVAALPATTGILVAAAADTTAPKPIKISTAAAPKILDAPGTGKDVVRLTNVPGIRWAVTGAVDAKYGTAFATSEKFVDVPVTANGTAVTVTASVADTTTTTLGSDIVSWTLPFTVASSPVAIANTPVAQDMPGTNKDAVLLTAVKGITWKIGTTPVPAFTGTKSFPLSKFGGTTSTTSVTVTPEAAPGYTADASVNPTALTFTTDATVKLAEATVKAGVMDIDDLAGRTRDTITFQPVPGIKWSICGGKPFAVTKVLTRSASCADKTGLVTLTATADKGFTINGAPTLDYNQQFKLDNSDQKGITIPKDPVTRGDYPGTIRDTLSITPVKNVVWEYAIPTVDAKTSKTTYKWIKAPAAKGKAEIIVKFKAAKGAENNTLYVRPRPITDDYAVEAGWAVTEGDIPAADGGQVFTALAKLGELTLPDSTVALTSDKTGATITAVDGVTAWQVVRTVTLSGKTKDVKSTVKVAPYSAVTVGLNGATKMVIAPVVDKSYALTAPKTWEFGSVPAPDTSPSPSSTPTGASTTTTPAAP